MRIGQLLSGIVSGYFTRGVQFLAAVALVPFLLRSDVLGLGGYGIVSTILALTALLRLFVEGVRLSFSRDVSTAVGDATPGGAAEVLGNRTKALSLLCTAVALPILVAAAPLLSLVGVEPSRDAIAGLWFGVAVFWAENALQLLNVPLILTGRVSFVNFCGTAEAILRTAAYFLLFSLFEASIGWFFAIRAGFVLLRNAVFLRALSADSPGVLRGLLRAPWRAPLGSITYSVPITAMRTVSVMVQRLPVILASALFGPEVSGLVALVVNTARRYLLETLFSVLQPIAIPIASRLDLRNLGARPMQLFWHLEALYVLGATLVIGVSITLGPELISLWLGPEYAAIVLPTQIVLAGCAIELSQRVREAMLVGQGAVGGALPAVLLTGFVGVVGMGIGAWFMESWMSTVLFAAWFFAASSILGPGATFWRVFGRSVSPPPKRIAILLFLGISMSIALALAEWRPIPGLLGAVPALLLYLAGTAVASHAMLITLGSAISTLDTIRRSLHRNIFAQELAKAPAP